MVLTLPDKTNIKKFWLWFASVESLLDLSKYSDLEIVHQLDEKVRALADVSWELGPGFRRRNMLAITPDGRPAKLPLTNAIVSEAPDLTHWEIHSAKLIRHGWNLRFSIQIPDQKTISIDGSEWDYVLYKYADGLFDIVLKYPFIELDQRDLYAAGTILVDGIIGEQKRLTIIKDIEVVSHFNEHEKTKSNNISVLHEHLSSLMV